MGPPEVLALLTGSPQPGLPTAAGMASALQETTDPGTNGPGASRPGASRPGPTDSGTTDLPSAHRGRQTGLEPVPTRGSLVPGLPGGPAGQGWPGPIGVAPRASLPMPQRLMVSRFLTMGQAEAAWWTAWAARLVGRGVVLANRVEQQTDLRAPLAGQSVVRSGLWIGRQGQKRPTELDPPPVLVRAVRDGLPGYPQHGGSRSVLALKLVWGRSAREQLGPPG